MPRKALAGEGIPIRLRVTNAGNHPLTLHLRGRPIAFDIVVSRDDGSVAWRRLQGSMIAMVLQLRTLEPGETLLLEDVWQAYVAKGTHVAPGDYTVVGELLTDAPLPLRTSPAPLRLLAP